MLNADVFARDPLKFNIPNSGVTRLDTPASDAEWATLHWELQSFVCEGQYARGLSRLLTAYLARVDESDQPSWWVSGFYGSGKSHFVRVLEHLWADTRLPDGSTARSLVHLPQEVADALRELDTAGRREGGLWSASGTLGAGADGAVRLAFATILFRAAGLPPAFQQARLVMWLREKGVLGGVREAVEAAGESWRFALDNLYMSVPLSAAIHAHLPGFASDAEVRALLREQFPRPTDLSDEELLRVTEDVLALVSRKPGKLPCTLVVLDEVQQFIGDSVSRAMEVQQLTETVSKRFGGKLLLVGTGQSAMGATPQLERIKARFPQPIELSSADVDHVVRQVILRKDSRYLPEVERVLERSSGELNRHLLGSRLAPREEDRAVLAADYPVLPTRRRLWDEFLRASDRAGSSGQLRSQLRIAHEASREVAPLPLGHVVGADFVYPALAPSLLSSGVLLGDTHTLIERLNDGTPDGRLRQRAAQLIYVLSRLDPRLGLRSTEATLADLLVEDLGAGSAALRARLPEVLRGLVEGGQVMQTGDEYRLQTREGAEWEGAFRSAYNRLRGDEVRQVQERGALLRKAVESALRGTLSVNQGASKTTRKAELFYAAPPAGTAHLPVWIRDGWSDTAASVQADALAAGNASPTVFVFLPEPEREALRTALAGWLAAKDVLASRPNPTAPEAREAQGAMQTRMGTAQADAERLIALSVDRARVFQGGGQEVEGGLRSGVQAALAASAVRLYPQFAAGDHARWDTALRQAKQGNQAALESVGHAAEPASHPVLRAILSEIGAGKKGSDLRKTFMAPPYGWPQDAVDTALVLLTLTGHLRALHNGSPVEAKQLDAQKLTASEFRPESVTLTKVQLIGVRGLYQDAGLSPQTGQEAAQAAAYLSRLAEKVGASGGEPPLPEPLSRAPLHALEHLGGNELLLGLYEAREALRALRSEADARADLIARRRDHWQKLGRLLRHNRDPQLAAQAEAIREGRMLLAEPDPVVPLASEVMNGLRADLGAVLDGYGATYAREAAALEGMAEWQALPEAEQARWRGRVGLEAPPQERPSGITEIVDALDRRGLGEWQALTEALPTRFGRLREEFLKSLEPQARTVRPRQATLKTAADVETYLGRLREELLGAVQAGDVVVIV
ncbi:BREX system P-loop protein BrxC [Deinococcus sp. NW-56]|uniref:BREX system P-loop protein BrxC n=1 Tax=Deinococcus sp. NW-56 TaxID=2080419 RepID=UPI000CF39A4A|nr:BREX system P-loop protein BrxC [Deinococcus sp. NW-56]